MVYTVSAQQLKEADSLYRPGNFYNKVEQFNLFPNGEDDLVFLGNSITEGTHWNELLGMDNAVNRGISGDTTFGVLERLGEVTQGSPAKVFLLIGVNDLARNIPNGTIIRNYGLIIDRIRKESPETQIYVQTLLPVNDTFTQFKNHYDKAPHILTINGALGHLAHRKKVNFIDLYAKFLDDQGRLDRQYTHDGLHLTAKGYAHWSNLLKPYLNP